MVNYQEIDADDFEDILEAIEEIPEGCQGLIFPEGVDFAGFSEEELIRLFSAVPATVENIILMRANLGNMEAPVLIKAFSALKAPIKMIELYGNELNLFTAEELRDILSALPRTLQSVSLRGNSLDDFNSDEFPDEFITILNGLCSNNPNLRKLTLKATDFENFSAASQIFPTIKAIHLEDEELIRDYSVDELRDLFSSLSGSINEISLFGFYSSAISREANISKLKAIFESCNDSVTKLIFENMFSEDGGNPLYLESLASLKPSVKSLTFKGDRWSTTPIATLTSMFKQLPSNSIELITLDGTDIDERTAEELAQLFDAFPASVKHINVKNSNLHKKPQDYLATAFSTLKASTLSFGHSKLNAAQLNKLAQALPADTKLDLSNTNLHELPLEEFKGALSTSKASTSSSSNSGAVVETNSKKRRLESSEETDGKRVCQDQSNLANRFFQSESAPSSDLTDGNNFTL